MERTTIFIAFLIAVAVIAAALIVNSVYIATYTITGTVQKTFIAPTGSGGVTYLVTLTDGTVLEVLNNPFHGINEDLLYSQIQTGHTYQFTCWGWVIVQPWIGWYWYPNCIAAKETT